jgi:hypothetical protein
MSSPYEAPSGVPYPPLSPHLPPPGYEPPPFPDPRRRRGTLSTIGLASAILLAVAALIVGIVGLNRPAASTSTTTQSSSVASPSTSATSDTAAADHALCEGVAPLIHESAERGRQFVDLGQSGTPERDAGIPSYAKDVSEWVKKIQPILDQHQDADEFLRRTLQRFIDDTRIYAESIRSGPQNEADVAAWNDKLVAIGGPYEICHRLGVEW